MTRYYLSFALALSLGLALPALGEGAPLDPLPESEWTVDKAAHLLRRAGFGGTPSAIKALYARGLKGAVDWLVDYEKVPNEGLTHFVPKILKRPNRSEMQGKSEEERRRALNMHRRKDAGQALLLRSWWMNHMRVTKHPLEEKMVLFWHGHFCSGHRDVRNSYHMYLQNATLRRHATGNFDKFVRAISRDPAMLEYLDNRTSRRQHPNENFARELMELFTLGVGNYTEKDIKQAARCFTGWTFREDRFIFIRTWHDTGTKTVLGKTGDFDGDDVIDIILNKPVTARYISHKLFRYFAHSKPSQELLTNLADGFRKDYQIKPLLRRLFLSREFYSERSVGTMIKSPVYLTVELMRNLNSDQSLSMLMVNAASKLGQTLLEPPNVKGWAGGRDWITTSLLLERYNTAQALVLSQRQLADYIKRSIRQMRFFLYIKRSFKEQDADSMMMGGSRIMPSFRKPPKAFDVLSAVKGCNTAEQIVDRLCGRLLVVKPSDTLRKTLIDYLREGGSLENREQLHGLLKLIVSTPEFQLS